MREEDSNWFSKWEEELPPPEELTPLSQTLISSDLALAFNIQTPNSANNFASPHLHHPMSHHIHRRSSLAPVAAPAHLQSSGYFDSSSGVFGGDGSGGGGGGGGSDELARTLKRPRLVWTPQLHKRFVDAVAHLGIKNAVPKTIMQLMSVDGLTRENVASHLQKYRLYLKRMQGLNSGGGGGSGDSATDHLFASSPVPAHFLHPQGGGGGGGRANSEQFMGYVPPPASVVAAHHHQQQVAAIVAGGQYHQPQHHRQMGHFGSPTSGGGGGQFEHPLLSRQAQMGGKLGGGGSGGGGAVVQSSVHGYVEDLESGATANGRKALSLFPTSD